MATPKIIPATPFSRKGDLGAACNAFMERLEMDEWALFMDHDIIVLDNSLWNALYDAVEKNPDCGAITCWTNYILNVGLRAQSPETNDIGEHVEFARRMYKEFGNRVTNYGEKYHLSGFFFCVSKKAWLKAGNFMHGFGDVDILFGDCLKRAGLPLLRMDGVYVYHRRITNGFRDKVKPSESIKAPTPAARSNLPPAMPKEGFMHEGMKISVILSARNEDPAEIRRTARSFREHGADEIIVVDDASDIPVDGSVGADIRIRNLVAKGCGQTRHQGALASTGNFVVWSDAHCRVRFGNLRRWASLGMQSNVMLCATCTSSESDTAATGARFEWRETNDEVGFKYIGTTGAQKTDHPQCLLGSVYGCSKEVYEKIGGWVPNVGFGYNEPALSLATRLAGIPILCPQWFVIGHQYRSATNYAAPYVIDDTVTEANRYWTHWLLFGQDMFDEFFSKIGLPLRQKALDMAREWMKAPEAKVWQDRYASRRKVPVETFLDQWRVPIRRHSHPQVTAATAYSRPQMDAQAKLHMERRDALCVKYSDLIAAIEKAGDDWAKARFGNYIQLAVLNGPNCKCNGILKEVLTHCSQKGIYTQPQA